jgi:hypothetical protein
MQMLQSTGFPAMVYILCIITSILCLLLLARGYRRSKVKLLLWSALCFVGLAINNVFLFLDSVLPFVNLMPLRMLSTFAALAVLLYGFIWEVD